MAVHNELGKIGEDFAATYLEHAGYGIIERDWRQRHRDLDIIARSPDGTTVVFVEVKTRGSDVIMHPDEAVDARKIRNLGHAANAYVKERAIWDDLRFDLISIVGTAPENFKLEHIVDAFNPLLV
ncbi:YraN family protein [Segatella oris]|uniref:YraN family protein n=1 Tax=Segatella oris TaxID=28135 RepID=UPI0028E5292E|nr:YraN family protein [Segatella oris]